MTKLFLTTLLLFVSASSLYAGVNLSFSLNDGVYQLPKFKTIREAELFGKHAVGNEIVYKTLERRYTDLKEKESISEVVKTVIDGDIPIFKNLRQATVWGYVNRENTELLERLKYLWGETRKKADHTDNSGERYLLGQSSDFFLEAIRTMEDDDLIFEKIQYESFIEDNVPVFKSREEVFDFVKKHEGDAAIIGILEEERIRALNIYRHGKIGIDKIHQSFYKETARLYKLAANEIRKTVIHSSEVITEFALIERAWEVAQEEHKRLGSVVYAGCWPVER